MTQRGTSSNFSWIHEPSYFMRQISGAVVRSAAAILFMLCVQTIFNPSHAEDSSTVELVTKDAHNVDGWVVQAFYIKGKYLSCDASNQSQIDQNIIDVSIVRSIIVNLEISSSFFAGVQPDKEWPVQINYGKAFSSNVMRPVRSGSQYPAFNIIFSNTNLSDALLAGRIRIDVDRRPFILPLDAVRPIVDDLRECVRKNDRQ
jgi:hypothetical protein